MRMMKETENTLRQKLRHLTLRRYIALKCCVVHCTTPHRTEIFLCYLMEHAAADCTGREGSRRPVKSPYNRIIETHRGYDYSIIARCNEHDNQV